MKTSMKINQQSNSNQLDTLLAEIVNSNSSLASSQLKKILDTCFVKEPGSSAYEPIMIPFNISVSEAKAQIEIPLITAIPITMLAIDKANIFLGSGNQPESLKNEGSKVVEYSEQDYNTNIQCEQQPLPQGLAILIEVLSNSISPKG